MTSFLVKMHSCLTEILAYLSKSISLLKVYVITVEFVYC